MRKKTRKFKKFLLILSIVIITLFISIISFFTILYNKYDLDKQKLTETNNGIKIYSSKGVETNLYNTNRAIVQIETLPEYVKNAFIDIEDKKFYKHNGYDVKRIIKAMMVNFTTQTKAQGASTISQQLIKNTLLSNEKTYKRKLKEVVLAIKMEKEFSKDEILEMYLNTIYFGSNAYGIENASKIYFDKSAKNLTINEACCLAAIIKSPYKYSPKYNYADAIKRKNLVARQMLEENHISKNEYEKVTISPIELTNKQQTDNSYEKESIFEACKLLNISEHELINRQYQIITFRSDELQKEVIKANNEIIDTSEKNTNTTLDSLSVVANNSGQVLAYYSNSNYNLHNLIRQPASTLKPLAVYLPCFKHNILSPASQILDEEINYNGYYPQNADKTYHGYVSCRYALSNSLNIPAVKALDYLGVKKSKETLENLGINISNNDLNLSLALGAVKNGIKVFDLFSGYMTLANMGYYTNLSFVNKILDANGKIIYSHEDYKTKVIDEESCFLVTDILKDSAKTGTSKRLASLNLPIASKTGTASNKKGNTDLYNITYSSEHTVLTWVADIDKQILPSTLLSSSQPTDINKLILSGIYSSNKPKDFVIPNKIKHSAYDLVELETNHILVNPNHSIERHIAYDYFKDDNLPQNIEIKNNVDLDLEINKSGISVNFETKKYNTYNIYKSTGNEIILIDSIKEKNGKQVIIDNNIFKYDEIEYYITNENNELISKTIKIRPKDYLINLLNNEVLSNKKKWLV